MIKREFPGEKRPSMQAVAINQRRERFHGRAGAPARSHVLRFRMDERRNLFYDAYERSQSCFEQSDFRAEGMPSPEELALLEPLRERASAGGVRRGGDAAGFRTARAATASCSARRPSCLPRPDGSAGRGRCVNAKGERLALEILVDDDGHRARLFGPWVENMRAIGIDASIRLVDAGAICSRARPISTST